MNTSSPDPKLVRAVPIWQGMLKKAVESGRLEFALGMSLTALVYQNSYSQENVEEIAALLLRHVAMCNQIFSVGFDEIFEIAGLEKEVMKNAIDSVIAKSGSSSHTSNTGS